MGQNQNPEKPTAEALGNMVIEDVLTRWPETAVTFQRYNMACVGCAVANFYTIAEAASVYGMSSQLFVAELLETIE